MKPIERSEVRAFLNEIVEVCKRHNLSLAHEDGQGAFLVEPFSDDNIEWLLQAHEPVDP